MVSRAVSGWSLDKNFEETMRLILFLVNVITMMCGLWILMRLVDRYAQGDFIVVMDCDLQDDAAYIPELHRKCMEGFDVVFARRRVRRFGWWKNITARAYYAIFRCLAGRRWSRR